MDTVTMKQAHRYALFNCGDEEVEKYISEHQTLMDSLRGSKWAKAQNHSKDFVSWFEKKVMTDDATHDHITWIAKGPNPVATKYGGAKVNAINRAKVTNVHTCGPKSFALIRERLKNANEDKKEPTSVEMFKATRKRVIGRVYKAPIEDTQNKIVQMEALQSQQCGENVESVDPFVAVLGNEHRVRLYGRGVTSSSIRKTSSGNESGGNSAFVNVPDGLLQKLTAQVTEQVTAVLADKFSLTMAYHLKRNRSTIQR
ncbi:hypothetical protein Dimus_006416 [Dionaea muscipula]